MSQIISNSSTSHGKYLNTREGQRKKREDRENDRCIEIDVSFYANKSMRKLKNQQKSEWMGRFSLFYKEQICLHAIDVYVVCACVWLRRQVRDKYLQSLTNKSLFPSFEWTNPNRSRIWTNMKWFSIVFRSFGAIQMDNLYFSARIQMPWLWNFVISQRFDRI